MKPKNQHQAIIQLLLNDWTDPITAFKHAGTLKLSTRVAELQNDFTIEKRQQQRKSKFGNDVYFFQYRIKPGSKVKPGLKKWGMA